jgi:hypothetical protein
MKNNREWQTGDRFGHRRVEKTSSIQGVFQVWRKMGWNPGFFRKLRSHLHTRHAASHRVVLRTRENNFRKHEPEYHHAIGLRSVTWKQVAEMSPAPAPGKSISLCCTAVAKKTPGNAA